jgi:hypothetical protein
LECTKTPGQMAPTGKADLTTLTLLFLLSTSHDVNGTRKVAQSASALDNGLPSKLTFYQLPVAVPLLSYRASEISASRQGEEPTPSARGWSHSFASIAPTRLLMSGHILASGWWKTKLDLPLASRCHHCSCLREESQKPPSQGEWTWACSERREDGEPRCHSPGPGALRLLRRSRSGSCLSHFPPEVPSCSRGQNSVLWAPP